MARKGMIDGGEQITWHTAPSIESEDGDRRTYIYTDESGLLDCKMPELLVFLQGSNYQAIKDLCRDGEVPLDGKSLTENCELGHNTVSCMLNSVADGSELPKERITQSSISNYSKFFIQHDCDGYVVEQCCSRNLEEKTEVDIIDARDQVSTEGYTQRITGEADSKCNQFESSKPFEHRGGQICHQGHSEEALLANSLLYPAPEEISSRRHAIEASLRDEVDRASIHRASIRLDIDSSIATVSSRTNELEDGDCVTKASFRLEDSGPESSTVSTQSLAVQNGDGESSSCTVDPSNSIACSGPISYYGNMSLRSNSSTRSFAFPILQSEWNGSPVKMTEPDRRHSRKSRPWRFHSLCCKF